MLVEDPKPFSALQRSITAFRNKAELLKSRSGKNPPDEDDVVRLRMADHCLRAAEQLERVLNNYQILMIRALRSECYRLSNEKISEMVNDYKGKGFLD